MLKYLLEKEFKIFLRNPFLPKLMIIMPFVVLAIFPLVANMDVKNIDIAIVDHDKSPYSRQLTDKILASHHFNLSSTFDSYEAALQSIEDDRSTLILEIPTHFEKDLVKEGNAKLFIAINAVNGVKGGLGGAYITSIISEFNQNIRTELIDAVSLTPIPQTSIHSSFRFNSNLSYKYFMIPALMTMIMAMFCGFFPALNIVEEKENGTIEQMNVTPMGRSMFILSKLIPHWVIGFVAINICMLVAWIFYGFLPKGSFITIYIFALTFIFTFCGLGLVVSNYAKTIQQAMFIMFFFVSTFIFLSGLFTPYTNMPEWTQVISRISPLRYIMEAMRLIYLKGAVFKEMIPLFLSLCCLAIFFNGWAVLSYRKRA